MNCRKNTKNLRNWEGYNMNKAYYEKAYINIQNLTRTQVDKEFVKRISKKVLKQERKQGDISIVFVSAKRMQDLNKRYRREDKVTDVLCFGQNSMVSKFFNLSTEPLRSKGKGEDEALVSSPKDYFELGEIIVCLTKVKKNAKEFKSSFEKELKWVIIHGILHILGYDHEKSEKQAKRMRKKEKYYLKNL